MIQILGRIGVLTGWTTSIAVDGEISQRLPCASMTASPFDLTSTTSPSNPLQGGHVKVENVEFFQRPSRVGVGCRPVEKIKFKSFADLGRGENMSHFIPFFPIVKNAVLFHISH